MDSLDFGLFSPAPSFGQLVYQCLPIIWISLVSLWPGLLSSFLRMIWCVPIREETACKYLSISRTYHMKPQLFLP